LRWETFRPRILKLWQSAEEEKGTIWTNMRAVMDGLTPGSTYQMRVRSWRNDTGGGAQRLALEEQLWSPVVEFLTLPGGSPPPTFAPFVRADVTHKSVELRWSDVEPNERTSLVGYTIQIQSPFGMARSRPPEPIVDPAATKPCVPDIGAPEGIDGTCANATTNGTAGPTFTEEMARLYADPLAGFSDYYDEEYGWINYVELMDRGELFTVGQTETALLRYSCGGNTKPQFITQRMLDMVDVARMGSVLISVPAPFGNTTKCTYSLMVKGLSKLTMYRFRIRTVTQRLDYFIDNSSGFTLDAATVLNGPWSPPSKRVRTRAVPADKVQGERPVSSLDAGVKEFSSIETLLSHLVPWPTMCTVDASFPGNGENVTSATSGAATAKTSTSAGNSTDYAAGDPRVVSDVPSDFIVYNGTTDASTVSTDEATIIAEEIATRGRTVVVFRSASDIVAGGHEDKDYIPRAGQGGTQEYNVGSNGVLFLDLYAKGTAAGPSSYPVESIIFAYQETIDRLPHRVKRDRRTISLGSSTDTNVLQPWVYTVPPRASSGDPTTYAVVKAWGGGGGCGYQLRPSKASNGTSSSADDDDDLFRSESFEEGVYGQVRPDQVPECAPGGGGAFVMAPVVADAGTRFVIIVGTGGKSAVGSIGGGAGWPGGGSGGNGQKAGGGGGGGSTVLYVLPDTEKAILPSLERLRISYVPSVVAGGGGGGGAADFCCAGGGPAGVCDGGNGTIPWLSPTGPAFRAMVEAAMASDAATNATMAFVEFLDKGYAPLGNFSLGATAGQGGSMVLRRGGSKGIDGAFYSQDALFSGAEEVGRREGAYDGVWLKGGNGASGFKGGGGGGAGLFGGAGGGAGVDAAGGGGGSSYIHQPALYLPDPADPIPAAPRIIKVNSVSVLLEFPVVIWPVNDQKPNATKLFSTIPRQPRGSLSVSYVVQRSVGPYSEDFSDVMIVTDAEALEMSAGRAPTNFRRVVIKDLIPGGNYLIRLAAINTNGRRSKTSIPTGFSTPASEYNTWKKVETRQSAVEISDMTRQAPNDGKAPRPPVYMKPPPLRGASLESIGSYLYLFGGLSAGYDCSASAATQQCVTGEGVRSETWRYQPTSGQWYQLPIHPNDAPSARERHTSANIDGMLYIFGGRSHPDFARDGGPYFGDMWRLQVGDDVSVSRQTIHPGNLRAFFGVNNGTLKLETQKMSCAGTKFSTSDSLSGKSGKACGLPDGQPLLAVADILTDQQARTAYEKEMDDRDPTWRTTKTVAQIEKEYKKAVVDGIGVVNTTIADDTCVEDLQVYVELVHPCLRDVRISLIGPGPAPYRIRTASGDDFRPGERGGAGQDVGTPLDAVLNAAIPPETVEARETLRSVGLQEIVLFEGGLGIGSSGIDFRCTASAIKASINLQKILEESPPLDLSAFLEDAELEEDPSLVDDANPTRRILHDNTMLVFDESAASNIKQCCPRIIPAYLPKLVEKFGNSSGSAAAGDGCSAELEPEEVDASYTSLLRGRIKPRDTLSTFKGMRAAGRWALRIQDREVNGATGVVKRWGLILKTQPCSRPYKWTKLEPRAADVSKFNRANLPTVPAARSDPSGIISGRSWFIWGGRGPFSFDVSYSRDLWRYDIDANSWDLIAPVLLDPMAYKRTAINALGNTKIAYLLGAGYAAGLMMSKTPGQRMFPTPYGTFSWGGVRAPSTDLDPSATSLIVCMPDYSAPAKMNASTFYACQDPTVQMRLWDPNANRWRRVHPSVDPFAPATVPCLGLEYCLTPVPRMYHAMTLHVPTAEGYNSDSEIPDELKIPHVYMYGGSSSESGVIFGDLWELPLGEMTALGYPFPAVKSS
jgi:subtilisin-like proprotein convertase family protein